MIVIIDYGMGNLHSIYNAFKRLGINAVITSNELKIENADKIILPGVGHFRKGIENLNKLGLIKVLNKKILHDKIPILGICLGMQLLTEYSNEGNSEGLGWIDAFTIKLKSFDQRLKIPHMGWNTINIKKRNIIFNKVKQDSLFYFVHSFYVKCNNQKDILSTTNYGYEFTSAIQKDNIFGMQFHPEKSHRNGLQTIRNFAEIV